jgi:hypothetical protein
MIPEDERDEGTDPEDASPALFDEDFEDYELWEDDE